jgi:hypothetical protein
MRLDFSISSASATIVVDSSFTPPLLKRVLAVRLGCWRSGSDVLLRRVDVLLLDLRRLASSVAIATTVACICCTYPSTLLTLLLLPLMLTLLPLLLSWPRSSLPQDSLNRGIDVTANCLKGAALPSLVINEVAPFMEVHLSGGSGCSGR